MTAAKQQTNIGDEEELPVVSEKSKKDEILGAYQLLIQKFREGGQSTQERKIAIARKNEDDLVENASKLAANDILANVAGLEASVRKWLSELAESLIKELQNLKNAREALQIEKNRLEEVHEIKAEADTLSNLILAHGEKEKELEKIMFLQRENWQKEQDEYKYQLGLKRRKEEDEYEEKRLTKERILKDREQRMAEQEEELKNLRLLKEAFDQRLLTELEIAKEEAIRQTREKGAIEAKLLAEKTESEKRMSNLTIDTLSKQLAQYESDIQKLKKELEIANNGVKDIALKVIESRGRQGDQHRPLEPGRKEEKVRTE